MKGIITDIINNKAVLLNENSEFIYINNKNYEIGQQISYKKNNHSRLHYIAACLVLFMFVSFTGYAQYRTPVSYIGIDMDSASIQLEVNCFSRVINAIALDQNAEEILDRTQIKNWDLNKSIDRIIDESKSMGFLEEGSSSVEINITTKKDELMNDVNNSINKHQDKNIKFEVEKANKDTFEISKELNLSVGRFKAIKEYTDVFGGSIQENAEKMSDFSVGDIKNTVKGKVNIVSDDTQGKNENKDKNRVNNELKKGKEDETNEKKPRIKQDEVNSDKNELKRNTRETNKADKELEKKKRDRDEKELEKNKNKNEERDNITEEKNNNKENSGKDSGKSEQNDSKVNNNKDNKNKNKNLEEEKSEKQRDNKNPKNDNSNNNSSNNSNNRNNSSNQSDKSDNSSNNSNNNRNNKNSNNKNSNGNKND
jgi:hypothetical protein